MGVIMAGKFVLMLLTIWFAGSPIAAQPPNDLFKQELTHAQEFMPVYVGYIKAIKLGGVAGLRKIMTPDCVIAWDDHAVRGPKADALLHHYIIDPHKDDSLDNYSVKVRRLTVRGDRAVAETEEPAEFPMLEPADAGHKKRENTLSATWYWKHTWLKTKKGWRLARWDKAPEQLSKKQSDPDTVIFFTVQWKDIKAAMQKTDLATRLAH
jgi:hypothetical protein